MKEYLKVEISVGNRKNFSLRFKKDEKFFPSNTWGGSNEKESAKKIKVTFHGTDEEKETDIDGTKRILRKTRGELRKFYDHHGIEAGDSVYVIKIAPYVYEISPNSPSPQYATVNTHGSGAEKIPKRRKVEVDRLIRDTKLTSEVKAMYDYACQVCGLCIVTSTGGYSEGAHIQPIGSPHDGPDQKSNILSLCPNHHVMLDRGVFTINDDFTLSGISGSLTLHANHDLDLKYVQYHREIYENA